MATAIRSRSLGAASLIAIWAMACASPSGPATGTAPATPAAGGATPNGGAAPGGGVAVVDLQRALAASAAGQEAKQKLSALGDEKEKPIAEQEAELRKRVAAFDKQKPGLAPEAAERQEVELTRRKADLDRALEEAREDLSLAERQLLGPLVTRMQAQLAEMAKEGAISLILDGSQPGLLYRSEAVELTDRLIERMNRTP